MVKKLIGISLALSLSACSCLLTDTHQVETTNQLLRATGDLGVIIERATGSLKLVDTGDKATFADVQGLGDLSHASIVFSRDERFAYVFGRDGGLTKVDLLKQKIAKRVIQSGNSIGGAISQDGRLVAVSNYSPGGVKVFDSESLELLVDIPATEFVDPLSGETKRSKVVGLVDAPGQKFVFSLFDTHEIWVADFSHSKKIDQQENSSVQTFPTGSNYPSIQKFIDIGKQPYDALISPNGRYYIAGLFGEDGMAKLDLWHIEEGVQRILPNYGMGEQKLPIYKMPHLEGWAVAGNLAFVPAVGQHQVLVIDMNTWQQLGKIDVHGQPIFVMARPDGRQIWVNFAFPNNDTLQVIESETMKITHTLTPGKGVLHMEFSPRGEHIWTSIRDLNQVNIYDTETLELLTKFEASSPSGIFFTPRAHKIGL